MVSAIEPTSTQNKRSPKSAAQPSNPDLNPDPNQAIKAARPVTPLGILVRQLQQLQNAAYSEAVTPQFQAALAQATQLAAGLDPYLEACTTAESEALAFLSKETQREDWSGQFNNGETVKELEQEMLSGHIEGQLLKMLVAISKTKRALEIGMFTGYSALAIAEALPADGLLVACEVDSYAAQFAMRCFEASEHKDKIQVKVAPAAETLRDLIATEDPFDLVFIDADKGGYIHYVNLLLESGLLAPDGFICVDNTLMQGQPYLAEENWTENGRAIAQFNRFITEDPRVEQVMLPIRDGFTIIRQISDRD